jgi:hypothetical protein
MEGFALLKRLYDSMNYPNVPLEESLSNAQGKHILQNAMCHLLGGYDGRGSISPSVGDENGIFPYPFSYPSGVN